VWPRSHPADQLNSLMVGPCLGHTRRSSGFPLHSSRLL
jgi:hypothetical protein